jgi:hypothetical protein
MARRDDEKFGAGDRLEIDIARSHSKLIGSAADPDCLG